MESKGAESKRAKSKGAESKRAWTSSGVTANYFQYYDVLGFCFKRLEDFLKKRILQE